MKKLLVGFVLGSLLVVPVGAQLSPQIFSTVQITSTAATALLVGCAVGSSSGCTGTVNTGAVLANDNVTIGTTSTSAAVGKLHFNSTDGITQSGRTGSTSDLAWYNAAGAKAAYLRAGTGRWVFGTNSPNNHAGVVIEGVDSDAFFGTVSTSTDPAREGGFLAFLKMANGSYYKSAVWAATVADDTVATGYMCANTHASYMNAGVQQDDVFILGCGNKGIVFWPAGSTTGYAALMPGLRTMHIRGTVMQGDAAIGLMPDVGDYRVPNGWDMYARNAADTDNYQVLAFSVGDVLEVGDNDTVTLLGGSLLALAGTSSAYPALKRSGTTVQVRLADDSGYGSVDASAFLLSGTSILATANTWTAAQTITAASNVLTLRASVDGNTFLRVQNAASTTKWTTYLSGGGEDFTLASSGADPGSALLIESGTRDVYLPGGDLYVTGLGQFAGSVKAQGTEGNPAYLYLYADDGDDTADRWTVQATAGGELYFQNASSTPNPSTLLLGVNASTLYAATFNVGASTNGSMTMELFGMSASLPTDYIQLIADTSGNLSVTFESASARLRVPYLASSSGTRYVCSDTDGDLEDSTSACSGTDAMLIASIPQAQEAITWLTAQVTRLERELAALRGTK